MNKVEVGLKALQSPHWQWIAGMVDTRGVRVEKVLADKTLKWSLEGYTIDANFPIPDFEDPATYGGLVGLVRKRHGEYTHSQPSSKLHWAIFTFDGERLTRWCSTEIEAWAVALDAMQPRR